MSIQQQSDGVSETLSNALAQLRLKLLDLTGRNRLINFKHMPTTATSKDSTNKRRTASFTKTSVTVTRYRNA